MSNTKTKLTKMQRARTKITTASRLSLLKSALKLGTALFVGTFITGGVIHYLLMH